MCRSTFHGGGCFEYLPNCYYSKIKRHGDHFSCSVADFDQLSCNIGNILGGIGNISTSVARKGAFTFQYFRLSAPLELEKSLCSASKDLFKICTSHFYQDSKALALHFVQRPLQTCCHSSLSHMFIGKYDAFIPAFSPRKLRHARTGEARGLPPPYFSASVKIRGTLILKRGFLVIYRRICKSFKELRP